jgi:hypothetical protein
MTAKNPISATVNFDQDGVQHGFLKLPHSYDNSGWGSMMLLELDAASMYDTAAENQGKIFIGTELAGGGSACAATIAKKGIRNILRHAGITQGALEADRDDAAALFISCTAIRAVDVIEKIEQKPGKPVITAVQAMFWQSLRVAGYAEKVSGYGQLLRH